MDDSFVKDKIDSQQQALTPSTGFIGSADHDQSPEVEATIEKIRTHFRMDQSDQDASQPPVASNYQFDEVLFFGSGGRGQHYRGSGWHGAEALFTWSEATHAFLHFRLPPTEGDLILEFKANGYIHSKLLHQDVLLEINDIQCCRLPIAREYGFCIRIPNSVVTISPEFVIDFNCLTRASPSQFKRNSDPRTLGLALHSLVIHESRPLPHPVRKAPDPGS